METSNEQQESSQISTSFFPPPPQVYVKFTQRNKRLLEVLEAYQLKEGEAKWDYLEPQQRLERQNAILCEHLDEEEDELPGFDLMMELGKPNMDWIEEDGGYTVFGQTWPIPDLTPTLEELGIPVLFPPEQADRKQLLISLLQTLLDTYRSLTSDLLQPAQPYDVWLPAGFWTQSTLTKDRLKHIENVVINMQFLINQLRPTQAKETLKLVMQKQLESRRQETSLIKQWVPSSSHLAESIKLMREGGAQR